MAEEISNQRENLAMIIRFIDASDDGTEEVNVFADAIVDLWVMIEDSCSIVRQVRHATMYHLLLTWDVVTTFAGNRYFRR